MARPTKNTVDYFPHSTNHKKTIFILEQQYGNDGYAFWFKLLELIGSTAKHFIDCNNKTTWRFLQAKTNLDEEKCLEILNLLVELEAIDRELWCEKIIWCQNFIDNITDVYKNRRVKTPIKPCFYKQKPTQAGVSTDRNRQSKVKESKVKESKVKESKENSLSAKKQQTVPEVKLFIDAWFIAYLKKFGEKYNVSGGKEGGIIKNLISTYGYNKLRELAKDFWTSTDQFIINSGYTIGTFYSQINKLQANKNNPAQKYTKAQLRNIKKMEEWENEQANI